MSASEAQEAQEAQEWWPEVYEELRYLAAYYIEQEARGHTLQPTALVHEAYVRLSGVDPRRWQDRTHFMALAATVMRRVLVDHARRKRAVKRGSGNGHRVYLDADLLAMRNDLPVLDLDQALRRLGAVHARPTRIVECRFFGGLTVEQTATVLGVSPRTVNLEWRFARAWLLRELTETEK